MNDDDLIELGQPLPRIASARWSDGRNVVIRWDRGRRAGETETVDLGPLIDRHSHFAPLRADRALLKAVRVIHQGAALGWDGDIEMSAVSVELLTEDDRARQKAGSLAV